MSNKSTVGIDTVRLRALHTAQMTVCEIAEAMETAPSVVVHELKKLFLEPKYTTDSVEPNPFITEMNRKKEEEKEMGRGKKITTKQITEMVKLKEKGLTTQQIAEQVGTSRKSVERYTKENEPATLADVTSSEDVHTNTSVESITHIEFNVKTAKAVSVAVKERIGILINIASDSYNYDGFDKIKDNLDDICILNAVLEKLLLQLTAESEGIANEV